MRRQIRAVMILSLAAPLLALADERTRPTMLPLPAEPGGEITAPVQRTPSNPTAEEASGAERADQPTPDESEEDKASREVPPQPRQ